MRRAHGVVTSRLFTPHSEKYRSVALYCCRTLWAAFYQMYGRFKVIPLCNLRITYFFPRDLLCSLLSAHLGSLPTAVLLRSIGRLVYVCVSDEL